MHLRSKLARNVQKIQPIESQSSTLSTNHMRAFRVVNLPETGLSKHPAGDGLGARGGGHHHHAVVAQVEFETKV